MTRSRRPPTTKLLSIGTMVLSTALLTLIEAGLARRPELIDGRDDADPVNGASSVVMLLLALGITLVMPATSYVPLLLLLAAGPAARAWRRLVSRRA